ncbi:MAG: cytochrome c [Planctomycetes bacterium]|nr:cytochrome c [Planctomycetota bacterium]
MKFRSTLLLSVLPTLVACHQAPPKEPTQPREAAAAVAAQPQPTRPTDYPGLHNVVLYAPGVLAGSMPEGEAGLETLAGLGVKTILSVDGGAPDVDGARAKGLRYVHVPIGYDGVPEDKALAIAAAIQNLPGPVYVHCHHGKHRSSGAAATACVMLGKLSNEDAVARMNTSSASAEYEGLFAAARSAKAADPAAIAAVRDFPERAKVSGLVDAMAAIDEVFNDNLKAARRANWAVPKEHPDLVPAKEAAQLADLLAQLREDAEARAQGPRFVQLLEASEGAARTLATDLRAGAAQERLEAHYKAINDSCKKCHQEFRDRPKPRN